MAVIQFFTSRTLQNFILTNKRGCFPPPPHTHLHAYTHSHSYTQARTHTSLSLSLHTYNIYILCVCVCGFYIYVRVCICISVSECLFVYAILCVCILKILPRWRILLNHLCRCFPECICHIQPLQNTLKSEPLPSLIDKHQTRTDKSLKDKRMSLFKHYMNYNMKKLDSRGGIVINAFTAVISSVG